MNRPVTPHPALIRQIVRAEVRALLDADTEHVRPEIAIFDPLRLYSVAAAAGILEMSKVWVYKQISEGKLPVVEFGDTRPHQRIRATDLEAFIRDHTSAGERTRRGLLAE